MTKTSLDKLENEKKLLPRLRYMGFLLLFFSIFTLAYALIAEPYLDVPPDESAVIKEESMGLPDTDTNPDFILTKGQRLNLFLVAGIFGTIGLSCFFFFWKKKEQLHVSPEPPDGQA